MKLILYLLFYIFGNKLIHIIGNSCFEYSCEACESEEYGKCTKCKYSFTLVDGTCPCDNPSCALCWFGYYTITISICKLCKIGHIRYFGQCICNILNCEICGENTCLKCKDSYYYNDNSKECIKASPDDIKCADSNCKYCYTQEENTCYECKEGYYLKYGICYILNKVDIYGKCPNNDYYEVNSYCHLKCDGFQCNIKDEDRDYDKCISNECVMCKNNILEILTFCNNNKELCNIHGCMVCNTVD
jgi:hypothetical protein